MDADGQGGKCGLHKGHGLRVQVEFISNYHYPDYVCCYLIVYRIIVYGLN